MSWSFADDRAAMFAVLEPRWRALAGARIFMTGGTGLIGRWMLEALRDADARLGLGVEVVLVTRDPAAFAKRAPHLAAYPAFRFESGDVLDLAMPDGAFSHVIHAATDASAHLNEHDPRRMFDVIVSGTRAALDVAVEKKARAVFLSSGAVYGPLPPGVPLVGEDYAGGPDFVDPRAAYAEGKRAAEMLCSIYAKQFGVDVVTARIFALLGPLLSLDIHFAAGNFIRDAMAGRRITVIGAGTAVRSYLYLADVTTWLWTILLRARAGGIYNVGSEEAVSVAELAARIDRVLGGVGYEILGMSDPGWNPAGYVPSTARIRAELGVVPGVGLDEAIRRTAMWNGWTP